MRIVSPSGTRKRVPPRGRFTPRGDGHPVLRPAGGRQQYQRAPELPQCARLQRAWPERGATSVGAPTSSATCWRVSMSSVRALRRTQPELRRLEPGRPLCPPARQYRTRQGALPDQSGQSVRAVAVGGSEIEDQDGLGTLVEAPPIATTSIFTPLLRYLRLAWTGHCPRTSRSMAATVG